MSDNPKSLIKKSTKALDEAFIRILEVIPEVIGFLQIMISPLAIGIVLGALIYAAEPSRLGLILGGCTAAIGLVIGVFCAANEWKERVQCISCREQWLRPSWTTLSPTTNLTKAGWIVSSESKGGMTGQRRQHIMDVC